MNDYITDRTTGERISAPSESIPGQALPDAAPWPADPPHCAACGQPFGEDEMAYGQLGGGVYHTGCWENRRLGCMP